MPAVRFDGGNSTLPQSGKSRLSDTTVVSKTRRGRKRTVRTFVYSSDL
jgi:hypothetical protein